MWKREMWGRRRARDVRDEVVYEYKKTSDDENEEEVGEGGKMKIWRCKEMNAKDSRSSVINDKWFATEGRRKMKAM